MSDTAIGDPKVPFSTTNIVHALNYAVLSRLLNYSDSRLHALRPQWDEIMFMNRLIIRQPEAVMRELSVEFVKLQEAYEDVLRSFRSSSAEEVQVLTIKDPLYPQHLKGLHRPPPVLFLQGQPNLFEKRSVAVVGTRSPSEEGARRAQRICIELAEFGLNVVSGLAKGIDTFSHTATLKAGGTAIAVIGTPLGQASPRQNSALQEIIAKNHLLVSQFAPGHPVKKWNFPLRNNTMVGLSDATVIVEASTEGGGAKIQGEYCLKAGRKLFIMKSFASRQTPWVNSFIERGATVLDSVDVLLGELRSATPPTSSSGGFALAARKSN